MAGANPHTVKPRHHIGSVFTLDDGFLVLVVPVLELSVKLDGDDLQVAWIVVPGEVTVHTDHIHKWSLRIQEENDFKFNNFMPISNNLNSS